ncbi:hypothetical protein A2229_04990 [Candidatus Peregrinibacteria bacterium RIFOXYA2_FULL_33_7]|nr:MAG: hypothetical protein A2229_04990 [Candidatus Peregrinibacteria bacterium RIFOXYA2_FULL_33_7]
MPEMSKSFKIVLSFFISAIIILLSVSIYMQYVQTNLLQQLNEKFGIVSSTPIIPKDFEIPQIGPVFEK